MADYVPIFITRLRCSMVDTAILDCSHDKLGLTADCMHSDDTYVVCQG